MLMESWEQEREVWSLRLQKQKLLFITMVKTVEDKLVGAGGGHQWDQQFLWLC